MEADFSLENARRHLEIDIKCKIKIPDQKPSFFPLNTCRAAENEEYVNVSSKLKIPYQKLDDFTSNMYKMEKNKLHANVNSEMEISEQKYDVLALNMYNTDENKAFSNISSNFQIPDQKFNVLALNMHKVEENKTFADFEGKFEIPEMNLDVLALKMSQAYENKQFARKMGIPELEVHVVSLNEPELEESNEPLTVYDSSSQICYGDEERLLGEVDESTQEAHFSETEKPEGIQDIKEEMKCQTSQAAKTAHTSSIIFEDKTLPQADMYICEVCNRVFANHYKLDSHQYRMHNIVKAPKKRGRKKKTPKREKDWPPNVQKLAKRVNGIKMFFCNLCSYSVNRCDSMTKHMWRIHSNGQEVPKYQCEVCGKLFTDKAYLRNHMVSHVTERSHECEVCGKTFHRQPSLKRHRQSHSSDKQFACTLCDYKTNRKHLMYKHVGHHETGRAYTCQICGSLYYTQISFRSHMYTHNISHNSCSFCKVGFSSRERMMCHMKKVHFTCEIRELKTEFEETKAEPCSSSNHQQYHIH